MKLYKVNIFVIYRNIKIICYDLLVVGLYLYVFFIGNIEIYL